MVIWDYIHDMYMQLPSASARSQKLDDVLFDLLLSTGAMKYGSSANWFDDRGIDPGPGTVKETQENDFLHRRLFNS